MAAKEEGYKSTADADIKIEAISQTHDALQNIMHVISGMAETMNTLGGKIESVAANVSKMDEGLAAQREDIEQLKKTPPRVNRSGDAYFDMPGLVDEGYESDEERLKPSSRRDSYVASGTLTEEVRRMSAGRQAEERLKSTGRENEVPVTVLVTQKNVPTHYQKKYVSIPDLWEAQEFRQIFISENSQEKGLIYFFTPEAHLEMIKSEDTLGTPLATFLDVATIYRLKDHQVVDVVVRLVRYKYTLNRDGFIKTIMGLSPRLRAYSPTWSFGIIGYDRQLHPRFVEWHKRVKKGWILLVTGITAEEKEAWPKEKMLTKESPGAIGIILEGAAEFGEDKLKKMDSVIVFLDAIEEVDKKLTKEALKFRIANAPYEAQTPMQELREQVSRPRGPEKVLARTPNSNNNNNSNNKPAAFGQPNYPSMPAHGSNNREHPTNYRGYPARQATLEEPDLDKSFASDLAFDRVAPEQDSGGESDTESGPDIGVSLAALMGQGKPKLTGDPNKPCFTHFRHGCDGGCGGYSHDNDVMEKLAYKTLEDLVKSKYGGRERTQRNLDRILAVQAQPSPERLPASRARLSLITGEPNLNPGPLVPIQGATTNAGASAESS